MFYWDNPQSTSTQGFLVLIQYYILLEKTVKNADFLDHLIQNPPNDKPEYNPA